MSDDVLRPVDDRARRLAGDLSRRAGWAALAACEPGTGHPLASRVGLASAMDGRPVVLISRLSAHFGALEADARASLLVGGPGRGDPLAHPRMTVIGRMARLEGADREACRARYLARHPGAAGYEGFADFAYWALAPERASLVGGFGRAHALGPGDLLTPVDDGLAAMEAGAVAHMNEDHADAVALYATGLLGLEPGAWRLVGIDPLGLDLMRGSEAARLWLDRPLRGPEDLRPRLVALARRAREAAG